ncbi:MAG: AMP-binding protein [Clostridia bacterium]|nr:AMP-binding protein [Clostridia bacterium]
MKQEPVYERGEFASVRELVEWAAATHGEKIAYSYAPNPHKSETESKSFLTLAEDVRALATALYARGCAGKHLALVGKMSYEWVLTYYAALAIGAILVPLDRDWTAEDLADTIRKADASFLVFEKDLADKAAYVREALENKVPVYTLQGEKDSVSALIAEGKEKMAKGDRSYYEARIDPTALALLVFTSGTTGKGKGVMLTQNAILADLFYILQYIDFGKKTVGVLPPHHTYGSTVMIIGHTMIGCEVYLSAGLRYVVKELKEQKPEHMILVPLYLETFYRKIRATLKEKGKLELIEKMIRASNAMRRIGVDMRKKMFGAVRAAFGGELRTIISGGAPLNPEIMEFFEAIGITVLNGYGITECAPLVAVNRSYKPVPGSVGQVVPIDTVKIADPNENGEGEICVKGINVMKGYYKDEEATLDAFDNDGYFKTGDYGRLNEEGALFITGRKKNLIILSNGKNVYPEEIENMWTSVPGVLDIVVYEGQSKRGITYNAIVAEIFPDKEYFEKNGIEDAEAYFKTYMDQYNKDAVAYKKIGLLKVREEEFPKNTLRKIMRFKLDTTIE